MSDTSTSTKAKAPKRVGPPCNPTNSPGGCGRPLPVSGVAKDFDVAKAEARLAKAQQKLAIAKGITVKQ